MGFANKVGMLDSWRNPISDGNRLPVDANISFAPELSGGDPYGQTDDSTYADGATVDAISDVVAAGKIVYIQDINFFE